MTTSAAPADAFYREVLEHGTVWTIRDTDGYAAPETPAGRVTPFWSLRSRAERVIAGVPAYAGFYVVPIPLDAWRTRWLSGLERNGLRAALNWSGEGTSCLVLDPADVERNLATRAAS